MPTGKIQLNIHNESWSTINLYSYIKIQANPQKYVPAKIKKIDYNLDSTVYLVTVYFLSVYLYKHALFKIYVLAEILTVKLF